MLDAVTELVTRGLAGRVICSAQRDGAQEIIATRGAHRGQFLILFSASGACCHQETPICQRRSSAWRIVSCGDGPLARPRHNFIADAW